MINSLTQNFHEFTRRAWKTPFQREALFRRLDQVSPNEVNSLIDHLNRAEWEISALKAFNIFTALKALCEGKLTSSQIFTLYQFKNSFEISSSQVKIVEIFFKNIPSQFALNLLKEVLPDEINQDTFSEKLSLKPLSEKRFFLIPDFDEAAESIQSITKSLFEQAGFNIFGSLILNGRAYQMVPSFGMIETLAEMTGAVKPNPVLGLSSEEDMRENFRLGRRDIAIETEETPLPLEADDRPANKIQFTKHDIYHLMNHLNMPVKHGRALLKIVSILDQIADVRKEIINKMVLRILDCEYYRANSIPDLRASVYFWLVVGSIINEQPLTIESKHWVADLILQKVLRDSHFEIPSKFIFAKTEIDYPGLSLLRNRVCQLKLVSLCQVPSSPVKT